LLVEINLPSIRQLAEFLVSVIQGGVGITTNRSTWPNLVVNTANQPVKWQQVRKQ
jgi:hypothetical protein